MDRSQQLDAMTGTESAGDPQNVSAGGLYRPISDRALVKFRDAGPTLPAERRTHHSGLQCVLHKVIAPAPVLGKLIVMLIEHFMGFKRRDAKPTGQRL